MTTTRPRGDRAKATVFVAVLNATRLTTRPTSRVRTVAVIVTRCPDFRSPSVQVSGLTERHVPFVVLMRTRRWLGGATSSAVTARASTRLRLVTMTV